MRYLPACSIALVFLTSPLFAAPKKKTLPYNCDQVWAAVKRATGMPHYNFAMMDEAQKKGIVSTGSSFSGKRNLDIALAGNGETCTIAIGGAFSGIQNNDKGDLFRRIDDELKVPKSDASPTKK